MKKLLIWISFGLLTFIVMSNFWIIETAKNSLHSDSRELLGTEVALVFGTSQYLMSGDPNPFFENRIQAASELIAAGKVEKLLLSGSKDSIYYDEAEAMKAALLDLGVSESKILLDKHGNRTLISLRRLRDVYGFDQCILITQKYHAYRALFIAEHLKIDAKCYLAESPPFKDHSKAILREIFARTKAVMDISQLKHE